MERAAIPEMRLRSIKTTERFPVRNASTIRLIQ
jgi:hypothetical protein